MYFPINLQSFRYLFGYTGDKSKHTVPLKEVVQSLSRVQVFATPWNAACQASLSFTISQSLLKLTSTESVMLSNHFILCHPLLLLLSVFPSIRVFLFQWVGCSRQVTKVLEFQLQHQFFNEYSGLISFRMGWFNLLAVQGTLKSPTPQFRVNTTIQRHQLFGAQPSLWSSSHIHTWLVEKL